MSPKKRVTKKESTIQEKKPVIDTDVLVDTVDTQASSGGVAKNSTQKPIHRRVVFSRVAIEHKNEQQTYAHSVSRDDMRSINQIESSYVDNKEDEKDAMPSHAGIIPFSQKEMWLRGIFYILLIVVILYTVYFLVAYGLARTTLVYEYQGDFLSNQVIEAAASEDSLNSLRVEILETSTGFLRVRRGPGIQYDEITKIYPGDVYPLLQTQAEWGEIKLSEGSTGWVFAEYTKLLSN